ncbi:hypothetical protein ACTHP3_05110 [Shouchella rhizosphaerae]
MLTIFQLVLAAMVVIFGLTTLGERNHQDKQTYGMVTCAAIVAMSVTFLF